MKSILLKSIALFGLLAGLCLLITGSVYFAGQKLAPESATALLLIAFGTAVVITAAVGAFLIWTWFAKPLADLATALGAFAGGDLTGSALTHRSKDEIGQITTQFNAMLSEFRPLIAEISGGAQVVFATASDLSQNADQAAKGSQEVALAVANVAEGATEQAEAVQAMTQAVDNLKQAIQEITKDAGRTAGEMTQATRLLTEMAAAVDDVVGNARTMVRSADQAAATARNGADVVDQTIRGIKRIKESVGASAGRIRELDRLSGQIGEVTQVIAEITDQTNLLALNAAIEAARAGEHGRGFGVVAGEVRRLAERAAKSTREINALIDAIRSQTTEAVQAMETGTAEVETGSRLAEDAGRALQTLLAASECTVRDAQTIADAAERDREIAAQMVKAIESAAAAAARNSQGAAAMAADANEVTALVAKVADISQRTASTAEQVSATAGGLQQTAESVSASSSGLEMIAQDFMGQVARFKL
ncbi:MAG TPA: HAMP domain-containing methyl-accepting chemotaxis protein [Symbiobacteriaceae bacterium]|jgi:methyl-accepting chemotaxis protein